MTIPVCEPFLTGREKEYVMDCLDTNWISSSGKYLDRFEREFARYCGCEYGISTTSGTTALHLALATLELGPGDEIIVPTFTIASCAFAVLYVGATPVFVDCDPVTYNMDIGALRKAVTRKTKVIMPVHMYGHPCRMDEIKEIAAVSDIDIIEDAAEAHGALYKGKKIGGLGTMGCFSFYANKIITSGEGGMIVTNDENMAHQARRLKNLAHSPEKRFLHTGLGFNYRMTNIQAAVGLAQLEKIDEYLLARRNHAMLYSSLLSGVKGLSLPIEEQDITNTFWMYALLTTSEEQRSGLIKYLDSRGIGSRTFFVPMHQQPMFKDAVNGNQYPVADDISSRGLYLPSGTGLTDEQINQVCDRVKEYMLCG